MKCSIPENLIGAKNKIWSLMQYNAYYRDFLVWPGGRWDAYMLPDFPHSYDKVGWEKLELLHAKYNVYFSSHDT